MSQIPPDNGIVVAAVNGVRVAVGVDTLNVPFVSVRKFVGTTVKLVDVIYNTFAIHVPMLSVMRLKFVVAPVPDIV